MKISQAIELYNTFGFDVAFSSVCASSFKHACDYRNKIIMRYLKEKYNDHHPAVLEMIRMTVEAGHRHGKLVYLCGEIAADTTLTRSFLEMGIDALSVVPACILPVRREVRRTDLTEKD